MTIQMSPQEYLDQQQKKLEEVQAIGKEIRILQEEFNDIKDDDAVESLEKTMGDL